MCIMFWKKKKNKASQESNESNKKSTVVKSDIYVVEEIKPAVIKDVKKTKIQKYHVSQNKDKDAESYMQWRVRKEGSDKTMQYFPTQKLAIDYAQDLATRTGTTVVIHKLDGSIRKQDYTNKV